MKTHDQFLALAAAAIDFGLTPAERTRLDAHLAECPLCARSAVALRTDALVLAGLPGMTLPERRGAELLYDAMHPARVRHPLRLVAIAALLALLALGSLAVGAELVRRMDDDRLLVLPPATATPAPDASAEPDAVPRPSGRLVVTHDGWIEIVSLDGGAPERIAEGTDPAWIREGQLAFTCRPVGQDWNNVCATDPESGDLFTLMESADRAAPDRDGRRVAIHGGMIDVGETSIAVMDSDVVDFLSAGDFDEWSPDGIWLAGQPESALAEVAVIRTDGSEPAQVLADGFDPAWAPDGDRIAYVVGDGGTDGGTSRLRVMTPFSDVSETRYEAPADAGVRAPAWLPDGTLVFAMNGDLWRLDPGAAEPVQLTSGLAITEDSIGDDLDVSPDGRWVAFTTGTGDATRVGIASVDGGFELLDLGGGPVSQPRWDPSPPVEPGTSPAPGVTPKPGQGSAGGPPGAYWFEATAPVVEADRPIGQINAVTAGGPGFVAVGRGCTDGEEPRCEAIVWTSEDGTAWQRAPVSEATNLAPSFPTSGPEIGMFDVAAGDPGIVAIGYAAEPDMRATAWFSPDGTTWERMPLGDTAARVYAVTWDGRQFVAVGEDRSGIVDWQSLGTAKARAAAWVSPDGRTWTQVPHTDALDVGGFIDTMEDPMSGGMRDVTAVPSGLVAVGSVCPSKTDDCYTAAWTSPDGVTWARAPGMPEGAGVIKAVASSGTGLVAVGRGQCEESALIESPKCPARVLTSPDGATWTEQGFAQGGDLRTVSAIGGRYFATAPDGPVVLWSSTDGVAWVPADVAGGAEAPSPGDVVEWHFAATPDLAIWLGPTRTEFDTASDPQAWVSDGSTP